jgi:enamine deaminase RidA (YjgF/YER057c/UK114 family)
MTRELVNPPEIHPPPGYTHIAIAAGGRLAFIAGQAPIDRDFNVVGVGDLAAQTRQVMANLNHALAALDADWTNVVKATVYTTEPTEYEVIGKAMADAMGGAEPPAQVIAGVSGLALAEMMIEIALVVSLP